MVRKIFLFLMFSNFFIFGKDYYVHQKHPKADDKNPGTVDLPFKTINGSLPHLQPGDTVYVREGVYREQIILPKEPWTFKGVTYPPFKGGVSYTQMISFIAYPGEEVVIKGSDIVKGWTKYKDNIYVVNWPFNTQMVFCDGKLLRQIGGKMIDYYHKEIPWLGRYGEGIDALAPFKEYEVFSKYNPKFKLKIECAGSFYYDINNKKLYVWLADNSDPNDHLMEVAIRPFFFLVGCDYIKISGFKMMHSNTSSYVNWAAFGISGSHCIVENVDLEWCDTVGIGISGCYNIVMNSKFNWCGNSGMGGSKWGNKVINCEFKYNNWRNFDIVIHGGAIKIVPRASNWLISNCYVAYNNGYLWFDGWQSDIIIQNNFFYRNLGGIHYEIGKRGLIKNNICIENYEKGIWIHQSSDTVVAHNLCYKNGRYGIEIRGVERRDENKMYGREVDYIIEVKNNLVWGNIFIDNNNSELSEKGEFDLALPDPKLDFNRNNFSDYNVFIRTDQRNLYTGFLYTPVDFEEWRKMGYDTHSIVLNSIDGIFVDVSKKDFRPKREAPFINFVKILMEVRDDITGFDRIYGGLPVGVKRVKFTAGPYEWREDL